MERGERPGGGEEDVGQYRRVREVEGIVGACMYLRRDLIDTVGVLDERRLVGDRQARAADPQPADRKPLEIKLRRQSRLLEKNPALEASIRRQEGL